MATDSPVTLNWGKGRPCVGQHAHMVAELLPCRRCGRPTPLRDCDSRPCHKVCAEAEIARA